MSKSDVFLWLTVKSYSEVSRISHWRCSVRKVFLEILQSSQENNCARVSFLLKLQAFKISKNTFSTEHLHPTASEFLQKGIDKFKEYQTNESTKKIHFRSKKGKHGTEGNELKCQLLYLKA